MEQGGVGDKFCHRGAEFRGIHDEEHVENLKMESEGCNAQEDALLPCTTYKAEDSHEKEQNVDILEASSEMLCIAGNNGQTLPIGLALPHTHREYADRAAGRHDG